MPEAKTYDAAKVADESDHAARVQNMFAKIARRYDLLNHLLSANIDKRWRRIVADKLKNTLQNPQARVLDVACGTGDLSLALARAGRARVIGLDFCRPMLAVAARKSAGEKPPPIPLIEGDALHLPFADRSFEAVTIAFGLRNLSHAGHGLTELYRLLAPGGRVVVLEFSHPNFPGMRALFQFYFQHILPRIGGIVSGSRGAYEYLPRSVGRFPDQKELAAMMRRSGFTDVSYSNLTGGIAAIHQGTRP